VQFFLQKVYWDETLLKEMKILGSLGATIFEALEKSSSICTAHVLMRIYF